MKPLSSEAVATPPAPSASNGTTGPKPAPAGSASTVGMASAAADAAPCGPDGCAFGSPLEADEKAVERARFSCKLTSLELESANDVASVGDPPGWYERSQEIESRCAPCLAR